MGEDASIDGFAARADGTDDEHADDDTPDDGRIDDSALDDSGPDDAGIDDSDIGPDPDDVAPTVTIYGWSSERAACAVCGASVTRRWRGDAGGMVCSDCKEW